MEERNRLTVLEKQVCSGNADNVDGYCIALPEHLEPEGMWTVRRWVTEVFQGLVTFGLQLSMPLMSTDVPCMHCSPTFLDIHAHRNIMSPYKLVSTFPAPDDDVRTMHDNLDKSVGRYPHRAPN
eukprot:1162105-Pelagomonas_calceolata.AAC.14